MTTTHNGGYSAGPGNDDLAAEHPLHMPPENEQGNVHHTVQLADDLDAELAALSKQHQTGVPYLRASLRAICKRYNLLGFGMSGLLKADSLSDFARVESLNEAEVEELRRLIQATTQTCHGETGAFLSGPHTVGRHQINLVLVSSPGQANADLNAIFCFALANTSLPERDTRCAQLRAAVAGAINYIPTPDTPKTTDSEPEAALDRIARLSRYGSTREFAFALVASLARRYACQQVAMGTASGNRIQVLAVSGLDSFKSSSPGIVDIQQAMEETLDSGHIIAFQPHGQSATRVAMPVHKQWGNSTRTAVCSIPIDAGEGCIAVVSLRRDPAVGFSDAELSEFEQVLKPFGPAIELSLRGDRSLRRHLLATGKDLVQHVTKSETRLGKMGRVLLLMAALFFLFGWLPYRPLTPGVIVPANLTQCLAAFDMQLDQVFVRSGDRVVAGQPLAVFDTRELELERGSLLSQLHQSEVDVRAALVDNDVATAALAKTGSTVLRKKLDAVNQKIALCTIVAPQDGMVVDAELNRKIGQVFPQGTSILSFAPMNAFELEIHVPEHQARHFHADQEGVFATVALPAEKMKYTIESISGSAELVDGKNVIVAKAKIDGTSDDLRQGMEGFAGTYTGWQPIPWIAFHRLYEWARAGFWL